MIEEICNCHCHNDHEGAGLSNPEVHCKCIPNCTHCHPENFKVPEIKKRYTKIIQIPDKVPVNKVSAIRLEFDEDGNFTEIAIDYAE